MGRRIFIGDIQGCRLELEELLEKLHYDPAADTLHPVGDLVNRGPDSLGSLRLLHSLGAGGVLGNHDLHLLQVARGTRQLREGDTLGPLLAADDREELLAWLASKPFALAFPDALLVHGGLHPSWRDPVAVLAPASPFAPTPDALFAVRARYCDPSGNLPPRDDPPPEGPFAPWHRFLRRDELGERNVVFGHWAAQGLLIEPNLRGLDTGCVWGGSLSAWIAEEDRVVQVPARAAYARVGS